MEDVQFDETNSPRVAYSGGGSRMTRFLIERKFAQNEAQANRILLGVAAALACLALFFALQAFGGGDKTPTAAERAEREASTQSTPYAR